MNDYQTFIHQSRYARFLDDHGRRETWEETCDRYSSFFEGRHGKVFPTEKIYASIRQLEVMPSMRALMTAGPALEKDEMAGFNCSYIAVDHPRAFDEIMYILMCGTGVGFSVERQFVDKLPEIADDFHGTPTTIFVPDSRTGWASSFRELVSLLYSGRLPKWDLSKVRGAGERLKTFGGRASGPEPLKDLFEWTTALFYKARGRRLSSLEVHDIICKIADIVVVGGVRRSALISLSNVTDDRLRGAKSGQWWIDNPQRALANNSACYSETPDVGIFMKEWASLYESRSGERGIFSRVAANAKVKENGRREEGHAWGTNPCGEIILRPGGLCNLSEVIVRPGDTKETLLEKVEIATIIGTFQSTLTNFRYVRPLWKKNAEEERLLGVSLTGIMDHHVLNGGHGPAALASLLKDLKTHAISVNKDWAKKLGIPQSAAITTVKPSGTVSQLVGCSSGIHPGYSKFYTRTVRADAKDPIALFLEAEGVPAEPDVTKPGQVKVFSFPQGSPSKHTKFRDQISAIGQLEHYLLFKEHWCEHNPSITVYVREEEWLDVGAWVFKHFKDLGGVSFLPHTDHIYRQAPYQELSEEEYQEALSKMPTKIDWEKLQAFEVGYVNSQHDLACSGGVCEI